MRSPVSGVGGGRGETAACRVQPVPGARGVSRRTIHRSVEGEGSEARCKPGPPALVVVPSLEELHVGRGDDVNETMFLR